MKRPTIYLLIVLFPLVSSCAVRAKRPQAEVSYHALHTEEADVLEEALFEVTAAEATYQGAPLKTDEESNFDVFENSGYVVGYSETRLNPVWVAYRLFPVSDPEKHDRPSRFTIDERTTAQINHDCYTNSGYDRGHNAPNSAIDTRYGRDAQLETFLMSNVSPQTCRLNREPWQGFEHIVESVYSTQYPQIYVMNGPIFEDPADQIGPCAVPVPVAFYKIVVEPTSGDTPRVLAVVMAQEDTGWHHKLQDFITTVDCVEQLTGLDFFSGLIDSVEDVVEQSQPDEFWDVDQIVRPTTQWGCPGQGTAAEIEFGNSRREAILSACM